MTTHRLLNLGFCLLALSLAVGCGSRDPAVLLEQGVQSCSGGHYRAAARSLERACRIDPENVEAQLWCGTAFWKAGKGEAALPHFMKAAELDVTNPLPLEYAALILSERKEWLEAAKRLNEAFRRMPESPRILNAMGVVSAQRGNTTAAHAQFTQALRLNPSYAPVLYNFAVLTRDAFHQNEDARRLFRRYLEVAPDGDRADPARKALETLGLPPTPRPRTPAPRVETHPASLMQQAQAALKRKDYDEAAVRLKEAVEAAPAWAEPVWALAKLYDGAPGKGEQAAAQYRAFLHGFADDPRAAEARVRLNALSGPRGASARVSPSAPPPGAVAAGVAFRKPEVRDRAEALLAIDRGSMYYQKADLDRAYFDFKRAVELDDTLAEGYYNLGLVYWCRGDVEHARQLFQTSLAKRPDWPAARLMLARVYFRQQLGIKAVEHLNEILKTDPACAEAYYELGHYYGSTPSRKTQVRDWYKRYQKLAPQGPYAPEASAWLAANP